MRIHDINGTNFKGYDARKLKGLFIGADIPITPEIKSIGRKEGFSIYSNLASGKSIYTGETVQYCIPEINKELWAQDVWTFRKDKILTSQNRNLLAPICDFFNLEYKKTNHHVPGGNFFIIDNNGNDELFIGENELEKNSIAQIKKDFEVDAVHVFPQMDYHLDLFIRPLDKNRVLYADDNLTLKVLENGKNKLKSYFDKHPYPAVTRDNIINHFDFVINDMKISIKENKLATAEQVVSKLKMAGYEPIPVPGRIYQTYSYNIYGTFLSHDCNYINALVLKNDRDELVYISNKSNIDKHLGLTPELIKDSGFSFQNEFKKILSKYINPNHIYFVDGENNYISKKMLKYQQGGIHCVCAEIPE